MANLPLDIKLSKLILLGHAFGMLQECIILAAALSTKTFFTCYFKAHLESFKAKWNWSAGWMCDCIAILNAYSVYEKNVRTHAFDRRGEANNWARYYMIELNRIREVEKLKTELESRLRNLGILAYESHWNEANSQEREINYYIILKMVICGAFYPNYFIGNKLDLGEAQRLVGGRDLKNTVQLKNMPRGEGILYSQQLMDIFKSCANNIQVQFYSSLLNSVGVF
jgi:ATP-dependent RNA helicase TDRD9